MSRFQRLIAELKRRRVFRVAGVYAAVVFVIWQVAEIAFPALNLPDWTLTLVVVLTLLGFPVAVVLAWALELTPAGVRRAEPATAPDVGPGERTEAHPGWRTVVVGAALLAVVSGGVFVVFHATGAGLVEDRIVVLPFENETGEAELEPLGRVLADWITEGLLGAGLGEVVPTTTALQTMLTLGDAAGTPGHALARETRAGVVVTGAYHRLGGELEVRAQILDGRGSRVIEALPPVRSDPADPMVAVEVVRGRVLGRLAAHLDEPFGDDWTYAEWDLKPPSYDVYRQYVDGVGHFVRGEYDQAIAMLGAVADSSYPDPYLWIATAYWNAGHRVAADSVMRLAAPYRSRLGRVGRYFFDLQRADLDGDLRGSLRIAREAEARFPADPTWTFLVGECLMRLDRQREAVEAFRAIDTSRGPMRYWLTYYSYYGYALHRVGDHRAELKVAKRARETLPGVFQPVYYEARALISLGRPRDAEAVLDGADDAGGGWGWTPATMWDWAGRAFRAYGYPDAAKRAFARGIAWHRGLPAAELGTASRRAGLGRLLYDAGSLDEARDVFRALAEEAPDVWTYRGALGRIAARQAHAEEAARLDAWIVSHPDPNALYEQMVERARIAALLGNRGRALGLLEQASGSYAETWSRLFDADLEGVRSPN